MDKIISNNNKKTKRYLVVMISVIVLSIVSYSVVNLEKSIDIELSDIEIAEVLKSDFKETISFTATTEPVKSVNLVSIESGRVIKIFKENGDLVKNGDTLLILNNENLQLEFMNKETHIIEQLNNLRTTKLSLENLYRSDQEKLIDLNHDFDLAKQKYIQDSTLWQTKTIAKNDFEKTKMYYNHIKQKIEFLSRTLNIKEKSNLNQVYQIDKSIVLLERNLDALKNHLNSLIIKSSFDGVISNFEFQIGESINKNQEIAKISNHDSFKAFAYLDEHYLHKINTSLKGFFEIGNVNKEIKIVKVYPDVNQNQFKVDFEILDQNNLNLTNGQSLYVKLQIDEQKNSKLIKKGDFYTTTNGNWIYTVKNNKATKREIKIGKQNSEFFEILGGLDFNEKVIVSSYNHLGNSDVIYLKE